MTGRLEVIAGPMFSGKTSELVTRIEKAQIAGMTTMVFRPARDTRLQADKVQSRNGRSFYAMILPTDLENSDDFLALLGDKFVVVAFDEAQFFDNKLIGLVRDLLSKGTRVIAAGLDLDYASEPYGPMPRLLALADVVDKYTAVCMVCRSLYATRTQRLIDGQPAPLGDRDVVDGEFPVRTPDGNATYESRCVQCYVEPR